MRMGLAAPSLAVLFCILLRARASPPGNKEMLAGLAASIVSKRQTLGEAGAPGSSARKVIVHKGWKELRGMCSDFVGLLEGKHRHATEEHKGVFNLCKALVASTVSARNKKHAEKLRNLEYLRVGREHRTKIEAKEKYEGALERAHKSTVLFTAKSIEAVKKAARWKREMTNAKVKCSELGRKAAKASREKKEDLKNEAKHMCTEAETYQKLLATSSARAREASVKAKAKQADQDALKKSDYIKYLPKLTQGSERRLDTALKDLGLRPGLQQGFARGIILPGHKHKLGFEKGEVHGNNYKMAHKEKGKVHDNNYKMADQEKAAKVTLKKDLPAEDKRSNVNQAQEKGKVHDNNHKMANQEKAAKVTLKKDLRAEDKRSNVKQAGMSAWIPQSKPGTAVMVAGADESIGRKGQVKNGAKEGFTTGKADRQRSAELPGFVGGAPLAAMTTKGRASANAVAGIVIGQNPGGDSAVARRGASQVKQASLNN